MRNRARNQDNHQEFHSRTLFSFPGIATAIGTAFTHGESGGGLIWKRPVIIRKVLLSTSFVGLTPVIAANDRAEVMAVRTSGAQQEYDAGTSNIVPGTALAAGAGNFQRSMDDIILTHSYSYSVAGTALSKGTGVAWEEDESWVLNQDEAITCFFSGDFSNCIIRAIMTVHYQIIYG